MKAVEDFELRPNKAVSFVVERDKEVQEWNEQKMPKVLPGYSGGRLSGRSTKRGRDEEEEEEDSRKGQVRNETAQEVAVDIEKKASAHEDVKPTAQRTVGQSVKQNWDCSQIENEEEEEDEDWLKEHPMEMQWDGDEKLEEILERRRVEGCFLQAEVMQKVPDLVVHERMSHCNKAKRLEEKKKVKGWPTEEMKNNQVMTGRKTRKK